MVFFGVAFIMFGVAFAFDPITFARSVRWVRDQPIPLSPSREQMRYYRASGFAFAIVGALLVLCASA